MIIVVVVVVAIATVASNKEGSLCNSAWDGMLAILREAKYYLPWRVLRLSGLDISLK